MLIDEQQIESVHIMHESENTTKRNDGGDTVTMTDAIATANPSQLERKDSMSTPIDRYRPFAPCRLLPTHLPPAPNQLAQIYAAASQPGEESWWRNTKDKKLLLSFVSFLSTSFPVTCHVCRPPAKCPSSMPMGDGEHDGNRDRHAQHWRCRLVLESATLQLNVLTAMNHWLRDYRSTKHGTGEEDPASFLSVTRRLLRQYVDEYDWSVDELILERSMMPRPADWRRDCSMSVHPPPQHSISTNIFHHTAILHLLKQLAQLVPEHALQLPRHQQRYFDRQQYLESMSSSYDALVKQLKATSLHPSYVSSPSSSPTSWHATPHGALSALLPPHSSPPFTFIHTATEQEVAHHRQSERMRMQQKEERRRARMQRKQAEKEEKQREKRTKVQGDTSADTGAAMTMDSEDDVILLSQAPASAAAAMDSSSGSTTPTSSFSPMHQPMVPPSIALPSLLLAQMEEMHAYDQFPFPLLESEEDDDYDELMPSPLEVAAERESDEDADMKEQAADLAVGSKVVASAAVASVPSSSKPVPPAVASSSPTVSSAALATLLPQLDTLRSLLSKLTGSGSCAGWRSIYSSINQLVRQGRNGEQREVLASPNSICQYIRARVKGGPLAGQIDRCSNVATSWREAALSASDFNAACQHFQLSKLNAAPLLLFFLTFLDENISNGRVREILTISLLPMLRALPAMSDEISCIVQFLLHRYEDPLLHAVYLPLIEDFLTQSSPPHDAPKRQSLLNQLLMEPHVTSLGKHSFIRLLQRFCQCSLSTLKQQVNGDEGIWSDAALTLLTTRIMVKHRIQLPPPQLTHLQPALQAMSGGSGSGSMVQICDALLSESSDSDVTALYLHCLSMAASHPRIRSDVRVGKLVFAYIHTYALPHDIACTQPLLQLLQRMAHELASTSSGKIIAKELERLTKA